MLIRFTDDYENYIYEGRALVGRLMTHVGKVSPFVGDSLELDKFYATAVAINAIADHLEYDTNWDPKYNENLLETLKSLLSGNLCGTNNQIPETILNTMPEPVDLNNFTVENNTSDSVLTTLLTTN